MMNPESVFPVKLVPSTTITAGTGPVLISADGGDDDLGGAGFKIMAAPEVAADTWCPLTVIAEPGTNV